MNCCFSMLVNSRTIGCLCIDMNDWRQYIATIYVRIHSFSLSSFVLLFSSLQVICWKWIEVWDWHPCFLLPPFTCLSSILFKNFLYLPPFLVLLSVIYFNIPMKLFPSPAFYLRSQQICIIAELHQLDSLILCTLQNRFNHACISLSLSLSIYIYIYIFYFILIYFTKTCYPGILNDNQGYNILFIICLLACTYIDLVIIYLLCMRWLNNVDFKWCIFPCIHYSWYFTVSFSYFNSSNCCHFFH